ncbi:hypothetical protein GPECTOR_1g108 [Gonium pectorale]|uniref:Uncharacterized protein n=1 Tax=Gonium pectorale TaxID=33097 RepID=A0A150H2R1_GONPE|nr:hypothetical protein GPECTOR_1g108 [Gonium pectorale]|eukprot:KXZ56128.1 hypothetical protein GPECTOR_1g108 [Gonium pectorale]
MPVVPGCNSDLTRDLAYFRFHNVSEFDGPQRTCRVMLERLRLKRSSGKASGGSGRSRDTRNADATHRASSSRSNSKETEDKATGAEPSRGLGPSLSGEGADSEPAKGGRAHGGSVSSIAALGTGQLAPWLMLDGLGGLGQLPGAGLLAGGGNDDQLEGSLQLLRAQNAALLPALGRRDAGVGTALDVRTAAGALGRQMSREMARVGGSDEAGLLPVPLFRDAPYGHAGAGMGGQGGLMAGASMNDMLQRRLEQMGARGVAGAFGSPMHQGDSAMHGSPGATEAGGVGSSRAGGPGVRLADDHDLEQQIRAIYREMDMSEMPNQQNLLLQSLQQQQHPAALASGRVLSGNNPHLLQSTVNGGALPGRGQMQEPHGVSMRTLFPRGPQMQPGQGLLKAGSFGSDTRSAPAPGSHLPGTQYMDLLGLLPQHSQPMETTLDVDMQMAPQDPAAMAASYNHSARACAWQEPGQMGGGSMRVLRLTPNQQHHQQQPNLPMEAYVGGNSMGFGTMQGNFGGAAAGGGAAHDGSRVGGAARVSNDNSMGSLGARSMDTRGSEDMAMPQSGGRGMAMGMASIPEAGDGFNLHEWCSPEDVDAALDHLMEEAGSGAVYQTGNDAPALERISFKLHNVHPRELPRGLLPAVSSWLAGAPGEVVQGSIRPGCTHLIIDVYLPGKKRRESFEGYSESGAAPEGAPFGAHSSSVSFGDVAAAASGGSAAASVPGEACPPSPPLKATVAATAGSGGGRVLERLLAAENGLVASLDAAIAAVGAEAMGRSAGGVSAQGVDAKGVEGGGVAQRLGQFVVHGGNTRTAMSTFKRILGPRAVQSMTVSVGHQTLTFSPETGPRHVADVRGTLAGLQAPLLLSVSPLAVVAGAESKLVVRGSHISRPGSRPHVRCRGSHVPCELLEAPGGAPRKLRPFAIAELSALVEESTLPGSHRAEAAADCTMAEVSMTAPESGLLALEWETERPVGEQGLSEWLPLIAVPDQQMAMEINRLATANERICRRLRPFLCDFGLVLDFVTRVQQQVLLPVQIPADVGAPGEDGADGPSSQDARTDNVDQFESYGPAGRGVSGGGGSTSVSGSHEPTDSLDDMMRRPRLSKKHLNRVAALVPQLIAFAADSGLPSVMSWLLDFMLEYVTFGDLPAVFQAVEDVGGPTGLPLLHRAVRSGNPRCVRVLNVFATAHGMTCNFAQAAGPFLITPLHLAALQPMNTMMLQACHSAGPDIAQLWHTITDAAGRTPAAYIQRQVSRSLHAGIGGGGDMQDGCANTSALSSNTSCSTTAYRSWGSDDPIPEVANVANISLDGMTLRAPSPGAASPLPEPASGSRETGQPQAQAAPQQPQRPPLRRQDSAEDFRERRAPRDRRARRETDDNVTETAVGVARAQQGPAAEVAVMEECSDVNHHFLSRGDDSVPASLPTHSAFASASAEAAAPSRGQVVDQPLNAGGDAGEDERLPLRKRLQRAASCGSLASVEYESVNDDAEAVEEVVEVVKVLPVLEVAAAPAGALPRVLFSSAAVMVALAVALGALSGKVGNGAVMGTICWAMVAAAAAVALPFAASRRCC